jgi:hypothetical protein
MGKKGTQAEVVTKHYGRLKSGLVVAAFKRTPFEEGQPKPKPESRDDFDEDEKEGPMIVEKEKLTVGKIGPNRYFRIAGSPEKSLVLARVSNQNFANPVNVASNAIPCVVVIDGRVFDSKGGTTHHVGKMMWLLPFSEIEELEMTERPEFTVKS